MYKQLTSGWLFVKSAACFGIQGEFTGIQGKIIAYFAEKTYNIQNKERSFLMKKSNVFIAIATALCIAVPTISASADSTGKIDMDEWYKMYNSLSDEEKLALNFDPNSVTNPQSADDYSFYTVKGGFRKGKDKLYYVYSDGSYAKGWQEIDGNTYYFNEKGEAATKSCIIDGIRYKFDSDGICGGKYTGWTKKSGEYYYYKNGEMKKNCWLTVNGKRTYYLTSNGSMATGEVVIGETTYVFSDNGKLTDI